MTPELITKLSQATSINFSGNSYSSASCEALAKLISEHKNESLNQVNFSDCFTQRSKDQLKGSLEILLSAITDSKLTHLNICDNAISTVAAPAMSGFMEKNASLKILNVSNCGLGAGGTKILVEALLKNKKV